MVISFADPWQALADPTRRKVLARVARGSCSVTEIARELPVSRPAVSQHLRVLLESSLVEVRQQGRLRLYRARAEGLADVQRELQSYWSHTLAALKDVAEKSYEPTQSIPRGETF